MCYTGWMKTERENSKLCAEDFLLTQKMFAEQLLSHRNLVTHFEFELEYNFVHFYPLRHDTSYDLWFALRNSFLVCLFFSDTIVYYSTTLSSHTRTFTHKNYYSIFSASILSCHLYPPFFTYCNNPVLLVHQINSNILMQWIEFTFYNVLCTENCMSRNELSTHKMHFWSNFV